MSLARLCLCMDECECVCYLHVPIFACVQGDYVLNVKELVSVSLFKMFWHSLKLLKNFFRGGFHS